MKLALFDEWRVGLVDADAGTIVDCTDLVPDHDTDPFGAGWWVRMCRDFEELRPQLLAAPTRRRARPLPDVRLRSPALNPGKILAAASNYREHVIEMRDDVLRRMPTKAEPWLLDFDVFLKSPSSIIGPDEAVVLPSALVSEGREIHHEAELTIVIGRAGRDIPASSARDHILGYTIALDMTVRGDGDRSRRKSYDTFTPVGPWITTADEITDPQNLQVRLEVDGQLRQEASTSGLLVGIEGIISYASSVMRLYPGDLILTGAPPGVGEVHAGEVMVASIGGIGWIRNPIRSDA